MPEALAVVPLELEPIEALSIERLEEPLNNLKAEAFHRSPELRADRDRVEIFGAGARCHSCEPLFDRFLNEREVALLPFSDREEIEARRLIERCAKENPLRHRHREAPPFSISHVLPEPALPSAQARRHDGALRDARALGIDCLRDCRLHPSASFFPLWAASTATSLRPIHSATGATTPFPQQRYRCESIP